MTYDQWKAKVNEAMEKIASVSCDDIDDFDYRSAFDAKQGPKSVAREALRNAGFPFGKE